MVTVPRLLAAWAGLAIASAVLMNLAEPDELSAFVLPAALMLAVGAFLVARVPGNGVAYALLVGGSAWLIYDVAGRYAMLGDELPGSYVAAWLGSWAGALLPLSLAALLLIYPTGRPGRGGRWLLAVVGALLALALTGAASLWGLPASVLTDVDALDRSAEYALVDPAFLGGFTLTGLASFSLLSRFRSGSPVVRQQIKWLLAAAVVLAVVFPLGQTPVQDHPAWRWALVSATGLLPLAVAVAIARYRLFDIDRLISRTVSYGAVAGTLALVFVAAVTAVTSLLPAQSSLAVAASTLLVAASFNPLRRRVQQAVDRRFNRARYDAQRVVEEFAASLRVRVQQEEVVGDWMAAAARAVQPSTVSVWMRNS